VTRPGKSLRLVDMIADALIEGPPNALSATPPYWPDDTMIPRGAHRFVLDGDHDTHTSSCVCGEWSNPRTGDYAAHAEAFDGHMADVQAALRAAPDGTP
jgi:hypothetical protein